jgi:phage/plasmid-like protein (TIGR03299 family)
MASEINQNDGIVLVGKPAWHGLGIIIPEAISPMAALKLAGIDWTVEESSSLTATFVAPNGEATRSVIETHKSLRRSDDGSILSTIGSEYCVLQNSTLAEIAESLGNASGAKIETVGSLASGKKVWFLLQMDSLDIGDRGDIVNQYALLSNSHDGSMALSSCLTSVRVVCANTLARALGSSPSHGVYRWRHTQGLTYRLEDIKASLAAHQDIAQVEATAMQNLASRRLNSEQIRELWVDVVGHLISNFRSAPLNKVEERAHRRGVEALAFMAQKFDQESQAFGPTAWVAANAATNWIQHERGRTVGDSRMNSDLFGASADAKRTVMQLARMM